MDQFKIQGSSVQFVVGVDPASSNSEGEPMERSKIQDAYMIGYSDLREIEYMLDVLMALCDFDIDKMAEARDSFEPVNPRMANEMQERINNNLPELKRIKKLRDKINQRNGAGFRI